MSQFKNKVWSIISFVIWCVIIIFYRDEMFQFINKASSIIPSQVQIFSGEISRGIFIAAIFVIIGIIIFLHYNKKERNVLNALRVLANTLNGSLSKFSSGVTGEYQGLNFHIALIYKNDSSRSSYLEISLVKNSFFELTIYRRSFLLNLGKKMKMFCKIKSNDEIFDRDFFTFSDKQPVQASTYLNKEGIKNTIKELFERGCSGVWINGREILCRKPSSDLEKKLEPQNISSILYRLNLLAGAI